MNIVIRLPFNWKMVALLIVIEVATIPFVALSNNMLVKHPAYLLAMGFIIAFIALMFILHLIAESTKKYLSDILGIEVIRINGTLYLSILSGFLLMFMFYIQDKMYIYTDNDYIIGLVSALFSVGISLYAYKTIALFFNYGLNITTQSGQSYMLTLRDKDIIVLTLLFSIYETIASPLSILWLSHSDYRFIWGVISGIAAGLGGGVPISLLCRLSRYKISVVLHRLNDDKA